MFCDLCLKYKKKNAYTTGCKDFQKSSVERHACSDAHRSALSTKKQSLYWQVSAAKAEKMVTDTLIPQLITVKYIAEQNLPLMKYRSLIELQQENGANISSPYTHHEQLEEMVDAISDTIQDEIKQDTANSKFIGLLIDESVDIAVFKKLVIYLQVVVKGRVKMYFAANKDVTDGRADTIMAALKVWTYLRKYN